MKTKEELKIEIEKLQKELEAIKLLEESKNYEEVIFEKLLFRIYQWKKQISYFPIPEDFRIAEKREFMELVNSKKYKMEKYPVIYFVLNDYKLSEYPLSRCYLGGNSNLGSSSSGFSSSNVSGRVVLVKELK